MVLCSEVPRQGTAVLLSPAGQAERRAEVLPSSLNVLSESPGQAEVKPSPPYPANSTEWAAGNQDLGSTSHPASLLFEERLSLCFLRWDN